MLTAGVKRLLESYPKIYFACHRRHLGDDENGRKMTQHQASILDHLDADKPIMISELARHMSVTESTMSINVAKLRRAGYVKRLRDLQDRRRVGITLTAAGVRVKEQNSVLDPELVAELLSLVNADESETALAGMEQLAQAAERLMKKRPLCRRLP